MRCVQFFNGAAPHCHQLFGAGRQKPARGPVNRARVESFDATNFAPVAVWCERQPQGKESVEVSEVSEVSAVSEGASKAAQTAKCAD